MMVALMTAMTFSAIAEHGKAPAEDYVQAPHVM
jgi:hypothetical protein